MSHDDPAPVGPENQRTKKIPFRVDSEVGTDDPRHVIFEGVADTEGGYNTVNMWDNAIVSIGIGQWTLIHGKLQTFFDYVRQNYPETYAEVVVRGIGIDLPTRTADDDLRIIVGDETLDWDRQKKEHDEKWRAFENVFRPGGLGKPHRQRDDSDGARRWKRKFADSGRDPTMQQCQYEYKCYELFRKFFRDRIVVRSHKLISKMDEEAYQPARGQYGTMWRVVDGDMWLQTLLYNLYVNAPYMAMVLIAGAIQVLAGERGWQANIDEWPERSEWRDSFVEKIHHAVDICKYREKEETSWRPWRDARSQKALKAYRALTGDKSDARGSSKIPAVSFDARGNSVGPANAIEGWRRVQEKLTNLPYL